LLPSKCGSGLLPRRNEFALYMALAHATEVLHIRCHTNDVLGNQVYSFLRAKTSIITLSTFGIVVECSTRSVYVKNPLSLTIDCPVVPVLLFAMPEMLQRRLFACPRDTRYPKAQWLAGIGQSPSCVVLYRLL
jgi:hypothetical protein